MISPAGHQHIAEQWRALVRRAVAGETPPPDVAESLTRQLRHGTHATHRVLAELSNSGRVEWITLDRIALHWIA